MIYTKLSFLNQPSNLQTLVFTLSFDIPLIQVYTAVFVTGIPLAGQIKIGANLAETISNTKTYLETNYPTPVVDYNISSNEILITLTISAFSLSSFTNIASVLTISEETTIMKKINIRSPYFIVIDEAGQTTSKIEIYLWNKGNPTPTIPQYTLSKKAVSTMQTSMHYNVSNYAKEYIKPIAPTLVTVPTEEDINTWCYMQVIGYSDDVAVFDEIFICLNGFNNYSGGYNQSNEQTVVPLVNTDIKLYTHTGFNYINVWLEAGDYYWGGNDEYLFTVTSDGLWKLNYDYDPYTFSLYGGENLFVINCEQLCEPKYTPMTCYFINRYGGWQPITFFKAKTNSFEGKSESYNLLPTSIDYNPLQGQKRVFNNDLKQKVKCNTGFVPENYSELIQDLMVSEVILLDNKPVNIITSSFEEKTSLKDKNINYEIEFEYSYNLINDVV